MAAIGDTGLWGQAYSPIGEKDRFVLPAFARKKIRESSGSRILCLAKHGKYTCLSGFGLGRTDDLQKQLEREEDIALQRGEEFETDARAAQLFGFSEIGFDDSGRFSLPEHLISLAGIEDGLYFHGGGKTMTVWSPRQLFDMDTAWDHAKVTCQSLMGCRRSQGRQEMSALLTPGAQSSAPHIPVLLDEVMAALSPQPGDVIVDATFGAGGYTRALLDAGATVHAFDRDPDAIAAANDDSSAWPELAGDASSGSGHLVLHPRRFSEMVDALAEAGVAQADGITMDIGVSSMQLDQAERGFAFSSNGPLDMRMSQDGPSAADFLNTADAETIADVLYDYGEERQSRRVARAIIAARPMKTTGDLARVVRTALGYRDGAPKDPATRSFQAIRIHVNAELDELREGLAASEQLLGEGGRLAVVAFHSLEDRIVKRFLRGAAGGTGGSRHLPRTQSEPAIFRDISKAVRAGKAELARNPRSRSAVLRHAIRTAAPARQMGAAA